MNFLLKTLVLANLGFFGICYCVPSVQTSEQPLSEAICTDNALNTRLDQCINTFVKEGLFNGVVLIAQDDSILVHKGYGFIDCKTKTSIGTDIKFRLGSISKQFTALAIVQLSEQGLLNLQDDICVYLPEFPIAGIKIHHLLTHTSGLPLYWKISGGSKYRIYDRNEILSIICDYVTSFGLHFTPGTHFEYVCSGFALLGIIVERVTGLSFEAYVKQNVFERIGMKNSECACPHCKFDGIATGYVLNNYDALEPVSQLDAFSVPGAASICATAEDLYTLDRALQRPGLLLSNDGLITLFTPRTKVPTDFLKDGSYAYGWFITTIHGRKCIGHFGRVNGFRTGIFRYTDNNVCIVILSNFEHALVEQLNQSLAAIILGVNDQFLQSFSSVCSDHLFWPLFEGVYACDEEKLRIFQDKSGNLYAQLIGHSEQKLTPISNSSFILKTNCTRFDFIINNVGGVDQVNLERHGNVKAWIKKQ
jgi:CubicO group peptidase (beta-lactamase class C family)